MGYNVYITRKSDWSSMTEPGITLDEWSAYVATDPSMRIDGVARLTAPIGGTIEVKSAGLAVWAAYSGHSSNRSAWFYVSHRGNIVVKNPDLEILRKMWEIAQALGAKVQGDEGEAYDANGEVRH